MAGDEKVGERDVRADVKGEAEKPPVDDDDVELPDDQEEDVEDIETEALTHQGFNDGMAGELAGGELRALVQLANMPGMRRSITGFRKEVVRNATRTVAIAKACRYAIPRKDKGKVKMIEGGSIRLAEIVQSAWKNCLSGSRPIGEDNEWVYQQGYFVDFERLIMVRVEGKRRITDKDGNRYGTDMVSVTNAALGSIVRRNAIFGGIPKSYWDEALQKARQVIAGKSETFDARRDKAVNQAKLLGVTPERICAALGVEGVSDIGVDEYVDLTSLLTAVSGEGLEIDTAFPPIDNGQQRGGSAVRDRVAAAVAAAKPKPGTGTVDPAVAAEADRFKRRSVELGMMTAEVNKLFSLHAGDYSKMNAALDEVEKERKEKQQP